jgi:glycosyltransferase involved in cell wall biosynthesis
LAVALVRRAVAFKPDVIHTFKPKAYAGLAHLALHRRFPVVVDTDDWEGPGGWNDINPYSPLLKRFFAWQERWGLTHAVAVTVASRALQTLVWATGGPSERVFYLPNGCIPRPVLPRAEGRGRPTLLLYTRFFEYKVDRLWRIVEGVRARIPDLRLWVVGKGFFAEEETLLALARTAGWQVAEGTSPSPDADLIYTGLVPPEDLPAHFAQADVALYPFDDTLLNRTKCPVKLLDLLAAGVPVVADAVGQVAESIRHGETGLLIPTGDDEAFIEAVVSLLRDALLRQSFGACAARDAREHFAWENLSPIAEAAYVYAVAGL